MEKAIVFFGLGISFILFPAIALIFCSISKHRPTKIECLYMGIHCLGGLASIFLLKLVTERLQKTVGIIRNKGERKSLEIKDNNHILSWCYELNAISSSCERFYTQLEEFIQTRGQENKCQ